MGDASRLRRTGAALVSLACLLALVGAVPLALWTMIGWPLPAGVPSPREVGDALTQSNVPDSTLLKAIALVGWIAWLQVAASVIVEVAAWVRGRPARRLRFASVVQPAMRRLVASAALLLGGTHALEATTFVPAPRAPVVAEAQHLDAQPIAEVTPATSPSTASAVPAIPKVHTVVRYDTLWGLAETHLGDAFRWREIYELNRGLRQSDGRALEDPNLIIPGWTLTFPYDANGVAEAAPTVAPDALAVAAAPEQHATYEAPEAAACPPPRPEGATLVPLETSTRTPATGELVEPAAERNDSESDDATNAVNPALLIGGGLGAAALVALLDRLRRVQRRRRSEGSRRPPPRAELELIERKLRYAAELDEAELLDLALRAFSAGVLANTTEVPRLLAVRVHDGRVELLLDRSPDRAPDGFVMTDDERGWITVPDVTAARLRTLANGAGAPCPGLVSLGDLEGDRLLIDIEAAGILTIEGDPECVAALIRRMAIEPATSTWVDHVDVIAVGTMDVDVAGAQRVRGVPTLDAALDDLAASGRAIGEALDSAQCETTAAARISVNHDDGWIPTILVCSEPIDVLTLDRLRAITGDGRRGVGSVVQSTTRASWHALLHDDELLLTPHGFHIAPAILDAQTARSLDELLTEAVVDAPDQRFEEPASNGAKPARTNPASYEDPPFDVEVRVLGPVEVVGTPHDLDGPRAVELAAYLALHPGGVSDDRVKTVLWPAAQPSTATFNTAVSRLRSRLGRGRDDEFHLLYVATTGGLYRLGPLVTTDVARFEARVGHARACESSAAIETLCSALSLVRGKPFDCKRGCEWAFSEGIIANLEATIADAAHELALLCLDANDPQGATWAAMQGLIAAPGDEILYRDRMLACDLAGNPAGVETVMDELCEVVEALEPYDELHPETLALYERLSHRKRTRTG